MTVLEKVENDVFRKQVEFSLCLLEDFTPDNEVPADPEENFNAWRKRKGWREAIVRYGEEKNKPFKNH